MTFKFKSRMLVILALLSVGCATQNGLVMDNAGPLVFYPSPPQEPRLQYLHAINSDDDLGKTQSALNQFILGKLYPRGAVGCAYDICSGPGNVYFVDRTSKNLMKIDLEKRRIYPISDRGRGALRNPSGLFVDKNGFKYVADMDRKQVVVFGPDDAFVKALGDGNILEKPVDVAVSGKTVYICDLNHHRIFAFDMTSEKLVRVIGEPGDAPEQLYKPTHIAVDADGNLYVNDSFNCRIQKYNPEGGFIGTIGDFGELPGSFVRPKGIDISREGHLYVLDAAFENAQIFDADTGRLMLFFGGPGGEPGNMYLPSGIAVDYENVDYFRNFFDKDFDVKYLVWVSNRFGDHKISVYGFGEWREKSESFSLENADTTTDLDITTN